MNDRHTESLDGRRDVSLGDGILYRCRALGGYPDVRGRDVREPEGRDPDARDPEGSGPEGGGGVDYLTERGCGADPQLAGNEVCIVRRVVAVGRRRVSRVNSRFPGKELLEIQAKGNIRVNLLIEGRIPGVHSREDGKSSVGPSLPGAGSQIAGIVVDRGPNTWSAVPFHLRDCTGEFLDSSPQTF